MDDKPVYLTAEGKQRLSAELHELLTVRRRETEERIRAAKDDVAARDNAGLDEAISDRQVLESRVVEIERILANAQIIEEQKRTDFIRMGSHVKVLAEGEEETYFIVGATEANPRKGLISNESPLGRSLIGKRPGDEAIVVAPGGSFVVKVISIS